MFGPGRTVPLDRNKRSALPSTRELGAPATAGQANKHKGPITRAFLEVLHALLWGFHNARPGVCYPS